MLETNMHAMRAERFSGYQDLKLVEIPKPAVSDGRVLVRLPAGASISLSKASAAP